MVLSSTKVSHERHHEETHIRTLCFLLFSLFTFSMAHWKAVRVPHIHFQLSSSMPFTTLCMNKSYLWMDVFCVFFLLPSQLRLSLVSVVFDFNDSLNDVAPASPILLSVDEKRKEKSELLMDVFGVSSFFCLHHPD